MYSWCSLLASCWMRAGAVTDARMMGDYVFNVKSYCTYLPDYCLTTPNRRRAGSG